MWDVISYLQLLPVQVSEAQRRGVLLSQSDVFPTGLPGVEWGMGLGGGGGRGGGWEGRVLNSFAYYLPRSDDKVSALQYITNPLNYCLPRTHLQIHSQQRHCQQCNWQDRPNPSLGHHKILIVPVTAGQFYSLLPWEEGVIVNPARPQSGTLDGLL